MGQTAKLILAISCLALAACQSGGRRAPGSAAEGSWRELEIAEPGQSSTLERAQLEVSENIRKLELLERCGLKRLNRPGRALERDLLLIRVRSLGEERFEKIYRGKITPHERACLIADLVGV